MLTCAALQALRRSWIHPVDDAAGAARVDVQKAGERFPHSAVGWPV